MKTIIIALILLIAISPVAFAQGQDDRNVVPTPYGNGDGSDDMVIAPNPNSGQGTNGNEADNQGEDQSLIIRERLKAKVQNATQLMERINDLEEEYGQEIKNYGQAKKLVFENQNRVRVAVHALLGAENLTGGIGKQVSEIAREFNNSVENTTNAEEKIHSRDWFSRFFFGGDEVAAADIEAELEQNKARLQNLTNLLEECTDCDEEVRVMLQEQIQNLNQEQERLGELAKAEKGNKGLFGWLWK